jgi:hypothetical protein
VKATSRATCSAAVASCALLFSGCAHHRSHSAAASGHEQKAGRAIAANLVASILGSLVESVLEGSGEAEPVQPQFQLYTATFVDDEAATVFARTMPGSCVTDPSRLANILESAIEEGVTITISAGAKGQDACSVARAEGAWEVVFGVERE